MATTFQSLKETMHARLTTGTRPPLTPSLSLSHMQGQANAISWKGMTLLNEASTIIGQAMKSLVSTVGQSLAVDDFPEDIDGAYLTSRLLILGPPRRKLADKDRFRNDADRVREFICKQHGTFNNTLCFDLAPSQSYLDIEGMRRSVVQFDLDRPTLETLREACAAVVSWLDMDEKNVAILTCTNGIKST
ncbi:MAG TPA: hypothetical protein VEF04_12845, partial [Blastocatellia bacterium]|nr:hypothetical protein [Blastocatellia bacterium]